MNDNDNDNKRIVSDIEEQALYNGDFEAAIKAASDVMEEDLNLR